MSLSELPPERLTSMVTKMVLAKLAADGTMRLLNLVAFQKNPLDLSKDNSLLIEFQVPGKKAQYRLLVSFVRVQLFDDRVRADIARVYQRLRCDLGVFWTLDSMSADQIQNLKRDKIDVISVQLPATSTSTEAVIRDFVYDASLEPDQMFAANVLANSLIIRLRKKFHLVLSEVAAPNYDDYGKDSVATKLVMDFETQCVAAAIKKTVDEGNRALAVDVGCGDGRHTRLLSKHFDEVVAFDFSPRMIEAAIKKEKRGGGRESANITYYVNDFEYEEFPQESDFLGRVDFVAATFGMASFVENPVAMLRRFQRWLRPGGRVFLSFYNAEAAAVRVVTPWRDTSLSATINLDSESLEVRLTPEVRFSIYCKTATATTRRIVESVFAVEKTYTYPHITSILPNSLFSSQGGGKLAKEVVAEADRLLAEDSQRRHGQYLMIVGCKSDEPEQGHLTVLEFLNNAGVKLDILDHEAVVKIEDVKRVMKGVADAMVKTVVFKSDATGRIALVALLAEKRVSIEKLAFELEESPRSLALMPAHEVRDELGYPIGGISPFCFTPGVERFVDAGVFNVWGEWLWMGVGDNRKTLKLAKRDFEKVVAETHRIRLLAE
jgi:ubiquinone/menaquinone biosynthesis C-methylase UbiE/prolyl-tRNA editing enzyme YbaK/EbsC (Cys-tRNA(Pro) deacylase)